MLKALFQPGLALSAPFMPHGHCYFWTESLIWLHSVSDALIVIAYYSIPVTLVYFVRKRRGLDFHWMFVCFAVFIMACGTGHALEIWNIWHGNYWLSGWIKALTAAASIPTAILLVKLVPHALALPTPGELEAANALMQAEIAERLKAEQKFRGLLEFAPDSIVIVNQGGRIDLINSQTEKLFCYSREELLGQSIDTLLPQRFRANGEDPRVNVFASPERPSTATAIEFFCQRKDGSEFPVEISVSPLVTEEGTLSMSAIRDITERKRAEAQIKTSLQEKEVLLKEIHHRVKNNLQVISSLLRLQSGYIEDKRALETFADSRNRIRSMALVHEKLYQTSDLSRIDFGEYAASLAALLFRSCAVDEERIKLSIESQGLILSVEKAIPCGLIVNELLSNCLKHAFPDDRQGSVKLSLASVGNGRLMLSVIDDGIGLPAANAGAKSQTLGLQLVQTLAHQLDGEVEVESDGRTAFRITFTEGMA